MQMIWSVTSVLIWIIVIGLLGLIVGSFLNVAILRYNTGKKMGGTARSLCLCCGETLAWYELIPLISFFIQKGKCRKCFGKISWQYPLVEIVTALLFISVFLKVGLTYALPLLLIIWSLLLVIFVYDVKHKIIPNGLVYAFSLLSLIYLLLESPTLLDFLAGPIFFIPFFLLWFISKGRWIGLGDGKFALGMGWLLGFVSGISAIFLAFWVGAFVAVILMLMVRLYRGRPNITMKAEIPFAPFLIIGTLFGFFIENFDVMGLELLFM